MQGTLSDPFGPGARQQPAGTNHHSTQLGYHRLFRAEPGDEPRRAVLAWACRQTEDVDHAAIEALAKAAVIPAPDLSLELLACAVRLNAGDIDGIARLELCAERLRITGRTLDDHARAAILNELADGPDHPATLGRVAAGIAMLLATLEPDLVEDAADDLVDDILDAPWLMGADADAAVLERVVRTVQRAVRNVDALHSRAA